MKNPKFSVGDTVVIVSKEVFESYRMGNESAPYYEGATPGGLYVAPEMFRYSGREATVRQVVSRNAETGVARYHLNEFRFMWDDYLLEDAVLPEVSEEAMLAMLGVPAADGEPREVTE